MNKTLLRPWRSDDAQPLAAIANNRKIWNNLRDQLPSPYTIANAEQWITDCGAQKPVINFAITYNNEVAGSIGCVPKIDLYRKNMEIGYFIGENFRIYAEVFANNKASMKVLQKNGFHLESIRRKATIKNNIVLDDYVCVKLI